MERYMKEHSQARKKSWRRDEVSLLHLSPFFKDHSLKGVTPESISQYKAQRYNGGAKSSALNRELSLMRHAFNLAWKEWGWIRENPMSKVKMEREPNARDRVLSYEDEERLLAGSACWLKEIIQFALNTGAREGEILSLQWQGLG